jgi:hypothetical protein
MFLFDGKGGGQGISHRLWGHPGLVGFLHTLLLASFYTAGQYYCYYHYYYYYCFVCLFPYMH